MFIIKEKGSCRSSKNLLIRASVYDTARTRNVLNIHQINTVKRKTKRRRIVRLNNTPVEDDRFRLNSYSSSGIYMTTVKANQCRIVAYNRIKQDEVKTM